MKILMFCLLLPVFCIGQKDKKESTEQEAKRLYDSLPKTDGQYEFTGIVQLDTSFKKDDLYKNAKLFFTNEFKSAHDVLQYDDRAEGKVIGKGYFHIEEGQTTFLVYFLKKFDVNFTLEIVCKDGKYKYRLYGFNIDFVTRASGGNTPDNVRPGKEDLGTAYDESVKGYPKKVNRKLFVDTVEEIYSTIASIRNQMSTHPKDDF